MWIETKQWRPRGQFEKLGVLASIETENRASTKDRYGFVPQQATGPKEDIKPLAWIKTKGHWGPRGQFEELGVLASIETENRASTGDRFGSILGVETTDTHVRPSGLVIVWSGASSARTFALPVVEVCGGC